VVLRQDSAQRLLSALSAHAALHKHAVMIANPAVFHPNFVNVK
jgi:hypothetical protein